MAVAPTDLPEASTDAAVISPSGSLEMKRQPLVSVIIVCYNQGNYLEEAIQSILAQNYPHVETIVVDDGSTDHTKRICLNHVSLRYVYQSNQGPSAARNTGIQSSKGDLLVFLDADDWLLPGALATNTRYLQQNPAAAFVSGAHQWVNEQDGVHRLIQKTIALPPYCQLLEGNYIGMLGAVMYQRRVFGEVRFDPSLHYCEDYDLYLKIARRHPVVQHTEPLTVYRFHPNNTSRDYKRMLESALSVLEKQKKLLSSLLEEQCFENGKVNWTEYYTERMYDRLITIKSVKELRSYQTDIQVLKKEAPVLYKKFRKVGVKLLIKLMLPRFVLKKARKVFTHHLNTG